MFFEPFGNDVLGESENGSETVVGFGRGRFDIGGHALIDRFVGLDAPKMSFTIGVECLEQVDRTAAAQIGPDFQNGFGPAVGYGIHQYLAFSRVQLAFDFHKLSHFPGIFVFIDTVCRADDRVLIEDRQGVLALIIAHPRAVE